MILFDRHKLRSSRLIRPFLPDNLLAALRLGWVLLVFWGEIGVFLYTFSVCRWPVLTHNSVRFPRLYFGAALCLFERDRSTTQ